MFTAFADKNILLKFQFFLLVTLSCFNILPNAIQSINIILLIVVSLFIHKNLLFKITLKKFKPFLIISSWLILLYLTTLYSIENKAAIIYIQKSINIIIIPFVIFFLFPKLEKEKIHFLLKIFVLSNLIFALYIYIYIIQNLSEFYLPELYSENIFGKITTILKAPYAEVIWYGIKEGKESILFIHKTYLSINLVFSVFIILHLFVKSKASFFRNLMWISIALFLSTPVLFFVSLANILILLFGVGVLIFLKIQSRLNKIVFLVLILLIGIFIVNSKITNFNENNVLSKSIRGKKNYIFSSFQSNELTQDEPLNIRALINDCSLNLIKTHLVYGYGLGEQHIHLEGCYAEKKKFFLVENKFNSHNYYYFLLLSGGLIVFSPFVYMLGYYIKSSIIFKNHLLFFFLVIIIINLFVENILTRINGILFFSIFLPLLYRYNLISLKNN